MEIIFPISCHYKHRLIIGNGSNTDALGQAITQKYRRYSPVP